MGLLHDIGKIGVPDYIINKTERLTDDEYMTIKSHPVIGAEVLHDMTEQLRQIIHSESENFGTQSSWNNTSYREPQQMYAGQNKQPVNFRIPVPEDDRADSEESSMPKFS